jgi:hypothetical protein
VAVRSGDLGRHFDREHARSRRDVDLRLVRGVRDADGGRRDTDHLRLLRVPLVADGRVLRLEADLGDRAHGPEREGHRVDPKGGLGAVDHPRADMPAHRPTVEAELRDVDVDRLSEEVSFGRIDHEIEECPRLHGLESVEPGGDPSAGTAPGLGGRLIGLEAGRGEGRGLGRVARCVGRAAPEDRAQCDCARDVKCRMTNHEYPFCARSAPGRSQTMEWPLGGVSDNPPPGQPIVLQDAQGQSK